MKREIEGSREENTIAPRLRPGEVMPPSPDGFVPTRVDGDIVFVSAPDDADRFHGNSPYTRRQIREIGGLQRLRKEQKAAIIEAEQIIFEHRERGTDKKYVSYD